MSPQRIVQLSAWILLLAVGVLPATAQEAGLPFLRFGVNAEASALGDVGTASATSAFAAYWNPAGLAGEAPNAAALSSFVWPYDVRLYALSARFQAGDQGGWGAFVTAFDAGDVEARETPTLSPDGLFGVQYLAVGASYGRAFGPLRLGATAKYLAERVYVEDASGYAFDFGAQLRLAGGGLLLGAAAQHLGAMSDLREEPTELPSLVRGGVTAYPFRVLAADDGSALFNLMVSGEVSHVFPDAETRFHGGVSGVVLDLITLRAGVITNDVLRTFTFGAGLDYAPLLFDYAFVPFEDGFGRGHVLTLRYEW